VNSTVLLADWRSIQKRYFYIELSDPRGHQVSRQTTAAINKFRSRLERADIRIQGTCIHLLEVKVNKFNIIVVHMSIVPHKICMSSIDHPTSDMKDFTEDFPAFRQLRYNHHHPLRVTV
jgi:hypothetical protein